MIFIRLLGVALTLGGIYLAWMAISTEGFQSVEMFFGGFCIGLGVAMIFEPE